VIPRYSVAFTAYNSESATHTLYVATLLSDNTWQITSLPERVLLGQFDIRLVTPVWSADGRTLFTTLLEEGQDGDGYDYLVGGRLASFDVFTRQLTPRLEMFTFATHPDLPYEALHYESISPDSRFAWVARTMQFDVHYLVNLETNTVVAPSECQVTALAWLETEILVSNAPYLGPCDPAVYTLDLATGEKSHILAAPPLHEENYWESYPTIAILLSDGRVLVGGNEWQAAEVGLLSLDGSSGKYFGPGNQLEVFEAEGVAVWESPQKGRVCLDLTTLEILPLNEADFAAAPGCWGHLTYHYIEESPHDRGQFTIREIALEDGTKQETILYEGSYNSTYTSYMGVSEPSMVAITHNDRVEIYEHGELVWDSGSALPGMSMTSEIWGWAHNEEWLRLDRTDIQESYMLNMQTLKIVSPPEPGYTFLNMSPDGAWWLYAVVGSNWDVESVQRLIAFHPATGEQVILVDSEILAHINFHFSPEQYYVWSPVIQ
jgi:hypothetical protein